MLNVTVEEVLEIVKELYPREFDRAVAELTIRKQAARIAELESQAAAQSAESAPAGG